MYKQFMNQSFDLHIIDGTDADGMPEVVEKKQNIACRIQYKNKLIISATGQQITSEGSILSMQSAKPGDLVLLNGTQYTVISCQPMYDFDNVLQGYLIYF